MGFPAVRKEEKNMIKNTLVTDYNEVRDYLSLLNKYGVPFVELRTLPNLNVKVSSKIVATNSSGIEEIIAYLKKEGLECGTVNCTFNLISKVALSAKRPVRDSDIKAITFLMIDLDSVRTDPKSNATNTEKEAVKKVTEGIVNFIRLEGLTTLLILDSGNGYHVHLPIEHGDVETVKNLAKRLLTILGNMFDTELVKIDRTVFNPARLGKLIGTPAVKGEHTETRPQRLSKIIEVSGEIGDKNSIEVLEKLIQKHELKEEQLKKVDEGSLIPKINDRSKKDDFLRVDVEEWFDYYSELDYEKKLGDIDGVTLYVFKHCPFSTHSNNQCGASVSVTKDGKARARCLHESDKEKTIFDLEKLYPVPEAARLDRNSNEVISIQGLKKGYTYNFEQYKLAKDGLWQCEENRFPFKISNPLFIEEIYRTVESNEIRMTLCYLANGEWLKVQITGDALQVNTFKQLTKIGLVFKSKSESTVIDFLQLQKEKLVVSLEHDELGWAIDGEELVYKAAMSHSAKAKKWSTLSPSSHYDLSPVGEAQNFDRFIQEEVLGTDLELAIAIGLTPILLGYFNTSRIKAMNNLMINLQGLSSTGKTAALMLIASLYGNPSTIVRNFNATNNAIMKLATDNHGGLPLVFDELGAASVKDLSSLFFQLASGEERLRMDSNRQLVKQQKFEVVVLMSSEEHIEFYLQNDIDGLKVRHLEFSDIEWTKSAKHADRIKSAIQNNYGYSVEVIISKLFSSGIGSLKKWFDESKDALLPLMKEDGLKNRIADNLALIRSAALMAINLLDWKLDLDRIDSHLVQAYTNLIDQSITNKEGAFEKVKELLILHSNKFLVSNSNDNKRGAIWGKVTVTKNGELKVNIMSQAFESLLKREFEVKDVTYIIKELLTGGKIQSEKGRRTKRVRINKQSITTYEIILPADLREYFLLNNQSNQRSSFNLSSIKEDTLSFDDKSPEQSKEVISEVGKTANAEKQNNFTSINESNDISDSDLEF